MAGHLPSAVGRRGEGSGLGGGPPDEPGGKLSRLRWRGPDPAVRRLLLGAAAAILLAACFVILGDVVAEDGRQGFDGTITLALHRHASPDRTTAMRWATDLGSALVTVPLFVLMVAWLLHGRERRDAGLVAVAWLGAQLLDVVLKPLYHRDRPALFVPFADASGYSFPSGHTVTALMTYGLLAYLLGRSRHGWRRWLTVLGSAAIVCVVGLSRVYLGVHFPSDVLGSLLVGGAWLWAVLLAFTAFRATPAKVAATTRDNRPA